MDTVILGWVVAVIVIVFALAALWFNRSSA